MSSLFSIKQLREFFPQIAYLSKEREAYLGQCLHFSEITMRIGYHEPFL